MREPRRGDRRRPPRGVGEAGKLGGFKGEAMVGSIRKGLSLHAWAFLQLHGAFFKQSQALGEPRANLMHPAQRASGRCEPHLEF